MLLSETEFNHYRSEEYALQREAEDICWHKKHDSIVESTLQQFNYMLNEAGHDSLSQIKDIFERPSFTDTYASSPDMIYMYIFYNIYIQELEENLKQTIFDIGTSYHHLMQILRQIRFFIWRIEFCYEAETLDALRRYSYQIGLSGIAQFNFVMISALHKEEMFKLLFD